MIRYSGVLMRLERYLFWFLVFVVATWLASAFFWWHVSVALGTRAGTIVGGGGVVTLMYLPESTFFKNDWGAGVRDYLPGLHWRLIRDSFGLVGPRINSMTFSGKVVSRSLELPFWLPSLILAGFYFFLRWQRKKRIDDAPRCAQCQYDLSGNESGVCPECGLACPTYEIDNVERVAKEKESA